MAEVYIPALLRDLVKDQEKVHGEGATVGEVLQNLDAQYPGIRARLCEGHSLKPGIAVVVDGQVARMGLIQPIQPGSEVHFLPAISGG